MYVKSGLNLLKYAVGIDPFRLYSRHSKTLKKANFKKHGLSLAPSTFAYKQGFLSMK